MAGVHKDRELGFSIHYPRNWRAIPVHEKDKNVVASFLAQNRLKKKKMKNWREFAFHTPMMKVLVFSKNPTQPAGKREETRVLGRRVLVRSGKKPCNSFREFTKRDLKGMDYSFAPARESMIKGVRCEFQDIIIRDKKSPLLRITCSYHLENMTITVFFEILSDWETSYSQCFHKLFKTFSPLTRTENKGSPLCITHNASKIPLTKEGFIQSKKAGLEKGWYIFESRHFLLLTDIDRRKVKKIASFADAVHNEILKEFLPTLNTAGPENDDEKGDCTLPVIRICSKRNALRAYIRPTDETAYYNPDTKEVVVFDSARDGLDAHDIYAKVGRGIFRQYYASRYRYVLPCPWLGAGMDFYYSCFKNRGKGCRYRHDSRAADLLRKARKYKKCRSFKTLLDWQSGEISVDENYWKVGFLVCFLKSRQGNKRLWKDALEKYLTHFHAACNKITSETEERKMHPVSKSKTKTKKQDLGDWIIEKRDQARREAHEAAFAGWDDSDWAKLEKAFWKWMM